LDSASPLLTAAAACSRTPKCRFRPARSSALKSPAPSKVSRDLFDGARSEDPPIETLVAALVPIYFGRVGSFVIENRDITTDQAEDRVERQARQFELLKPYLVERWKASQPAAAAAAPVEA